MHLFRLDCRCSTTNSNMLTLLIPCEGDSTVGTVGLSKAQMHLSHMTPAVWQLVGGEGPTTEGTGKARRCFQHACIGWHSFQRWKVFHKKTITKLHVKTEIWKDWNDNTRCYTVNSDLCGLHFLFFWNAEHILGWREGKRWNEIWVKLMRDSRAVRCIGYS